MRSPSCPDGYVEAFAPATVANVGPGFDCFGFALDGLGDRVYVRMCETPGLHICEVRGDGGCLPREIERNCAGRAALSFWSDPRLQGLGLELIVDKGLPLCSGLGSSAASAVAGALAASFFRRQVTGERYDAGALMQAALDGEQIAAGARHADNVAPSLLGGFCLVQSNAPTRVVQVHCPEPLFASVVMPDLRIATQDARAALPAQVPLGDAVRNWSNTAALVLALERADWDLLSAALVDVIVEPRRASLIAGFAEARAAALEAGALGCSISGSGPTLFALSTTQAIAEQASEALAHHLGQRHDIVLRHVGLLTEQGAQIT